MYRIIRAKHRNSGTLEAILGPVIPGHDSGSSAERWTSLVFDPSGADVFAHRTCCWRLFIPGVDALMRQLGKNASLGAIQKKKMPQLVETPK